MWQTPRRVRENLLIPWWARGGVYYEADCVGRFAPFDFAHRDVRRQHHEHNAARSLRQHRPRLRPGNLEAQLDHNMLTSQECGIVRAASTQRWGGGRQLNDVLSVGLHRVWKRAAIKWSGATVGNCVLDVCCGSGDLALRLASVVGPTGAVRCPGLSALFLGGTGR